MATTTKTIPEAKRHRAPGRHERKGVTLAELFRMFPDDQTAEAWFVERRWPDGVRCPHCGSDNVLDGAKHKTMRFRCRGCRTRFSTRTGTALADSNVGYQTWAIAIYQVCTSLKGVSSMKLHRDLGVTQKTAWFMLHRVREAWASTSHRFEGPVEIDEVYVGGRAKNMHAKRRRQLVRGSGHTDNMEVLMGVKDRATNRVVVKHVPDKRGRTLIGVLEDAVPKGAVVYSDDAGIYDNLNRLGYQHATVRHKDGEYVRGDVHTNSIESMWSLFKRGYYGTYHHLSRAHLHRYTNEFSGRFNLRPLDTVTQMGRVVEGLIGKRLRYTELIADGPAARKRAMEAAGIPPGHPF